jgi:S-layer protein (TIGR01567 family)
MGLLAIDKLISRTIVNHLHAAVIIAMLVSLLIISEAEALDHIEVRGAVAGTINGQSNLVDNTFTWNPQNFAGFFYDIKKDLGTETLKFTLTEGNKLSGDYPYGITYTTTAQYKDFDFKGWGSYKIIGFQAEKYFGGYMWNADSAKNMFFSVSTDENSFANGQLEQILIDDDNQMTVTSGTPLKLEEGYELAIKSIDYDGNKVYIELSKNGAVVDSKVVSPSKDGATEVDKTYYYRNQQVGVQRKLITIAVHFKNAFRGVDSNLATVDGIWQISDTPIEVRVDTQYDKMTINYVDATAGTITMDNKDNAVTLSKNKNVELMPGVSIQTADNDTLRFFICKPVTIDGSAVTAAETISIDSTPAAEATPVAEQNKAVEVAPAAEIIPVAEVNKAVENASAVEAAPSAGTTPTYASGAAPTTEKTAEPGVSDFLRNLATTLTLFGSVYASARLIRSYTTTNISIISPKDNDRNWTGFVEGTSKRVDGKVKYIYVIIRLDNGQLLVAKKAKLDNRGFWEAKCNIPKSISYNIYAIVMDDALNEIKEGEMLEKIPNHLAITHVASISRASDFSFKD